MRSRTATLLAFVVLICGTARAEDGLTTGCSDPDPDNRIAACSIFIDSGQGLKPDIAMALNNRGIGYLEKRDYGLAILDLNEALALVPDLAIALNNRCYILAAAGRPERALKDCDEALTFITKQRTGIGLARLTCISGSDAMVRPSGTLIECSRRMRPYQPRFMFGEQQSLNWETQPGGMT